ncbi:hypothetical protein AcW2_000141 [Taiwanofungus camphoratus]|nr:hypothetical protein AcW2_000141 [Antrodia cinnamomea]
MPFQGTQRWPSHNHRHLNPFTACVLPTGALYEVICDVSQRPSPDKVITRLERPCLAQGKDLKHMTSPRSTYIRKNQGSS